MSLLNNSLKQIEEEIQSIKSEDIQSIIFRNDNGYYLYVKSDIKYPLSNSELLYDNLLFEIKINSRLMIIDGISMPFFMSTTEEKKLVKDVRGVSAPIFVTTGTMVELRPMDLVLENVGYLYKYFLGTNLSIGNIYSLLISSDFDKIYEGVMTLPTKYVLLGK